MARLLDQLYTTTLQLIAVVATACGLALMAAGYWPGAPSWLANPFVQNVGGGLFTSGVVGLFYEAIDRKVGNQRTAQFLMDTFAFTPDTLKNIASEDTLDRIATNALGLRLGDPRLAHDVYTDIHTQAVRATERWRDVDVAVDLVPWADGPAAGYGSMFVATIRWEYRVVPANSTLRFACVSDDTEYRELLHDRSTTSVWYFEPINHLDASSPEAFELVEFTVNGKARPIRRTARTGTQIYTANLGKAASGDQDVVLAYTCRVLVQRHSHMLAIEIPQLSKGLKISFRYGEAGIRHINVVDYIGAAQQARIARAPAAVPTPAIEVSYDHWILARSGVAFVWVLEDELERSVATTRHA
jgi:hypothetical protein